MTETTTDPAIEEGLARVAKLTRTAATARRKADAAIDERTELIGSLLASGVRLSLIARRAGVTHGALQAASKAAAKKAGR
jgi:hypothetical protein